MERAEALRLLGLQDTFSLRELKKAYRKKLSENHPDRFTSTREKTLAHHRFILIQEAFETLSQSQESPIYRKAKAHATTHPPTRFHPPLYDLSGYENLENDGSLSNIYKCLSDLCKYFVAFIQIPFLGWAVYWACNPCFMVIEICLRLTGGLSKLFYRLFFGVSHQEDLIKQAIHEPSLLFIRPILFISLMAPLLYYFSWLTLTETIPRTQENRIFCYRLLIAWGTPVIIMMLLETFAALTSFARGRRLKWQLSTK